MEKKKPKIDMRFLTRAAVIAALYCVLTLILTPISFGPVQFRLAEALCILPLFLFEAIPGLFVGCMLANVIGGLGPVDIVFGSLTTLVAAYLTYRMPNKYLAVIPPIILNAVFVSIWVSILYAVPYFATVLSIGLGELGTAGIGGILLAIAFDKLPKKYIS